MQPRPISGWFTWRWQGGIDTAGRIYEWYRTPGALTGDVLLRFDSTLSRADTLALPSYEGATFTLERKNARSSAGVPFSPSLTWAFDPRGCVWFGVTAPYRIYQRTLTGDTIRVFERPYTPLPVSVAERDSAVKGLAWFVEQGGTIDASRIPREQPAFERFVIDDEGNLWVSVVTADRKEGTAFDVFEPNGGYQGRVLIRSPLMRTSPLLIRRSRLYGVTTDADGIPFIIRLSPPVDRQR